MFHIYFSCAVHQHEKRQLKHLMPTYVLPFEVATIAIFYQVSSRNSGTFVFSIGNHGASMSPEWLTMPERIYNSHYGCPAER